MVMKCAKCKYLRILSHVLFVNCQKLGLLEFMLSAKCFWMEIGMVGDFLTKLNR